MKDQPHIFISYAREDRARVALLARFFEDEGWSVWWDRDNLPVGGQFHRVIDEAIDAAACVLVCWSGASVDSDWVIAEANEGLDQKKLLPVLLETVRQPLRFRPYHAIDFSTWDERVSHEAYQRLKAELQRWQPLSGDRSVDEGIGATETASEPTIVDDAQPPQDSLAKDQLTPEARKLVAELESPETQPKRRLEIGDELDDMPGGDPRFGIGLGRDGFPEIDWIKMPQGSFIYGEDSDETEKVLSAFEIARYPVTNRQYQAFVDDGGYDDKRWWQGLKKPEPEQPSWPQGNRPRTNIDWFEATAFARWLSWRLGQSITLPHEYQWERAARGKEGLAYPWGDEYQTGFANVNDSEMENGVSLQQTSAVGVFPQGSSQDGVADLSGNVWEWCRNDYNKPDDDNDVPGTPVLRGGSWYYYPESARAAFRLDWFFPDYRGHFIGFRLLRSPPS